MYRTQIRVTVTNQVQQLLSLAALELDLDRTTYLQCMTVDAVWRDAGVDVSDLFPRVHPQSAVARSKIGGVRRDYKQAKPGQATISFIAYAPAPMLLNRVATENGLGSISAYLRRELKASLAWVLDMDEDEITMPKSAAEMIHPIFGEGKRRPIEDVPNTHLRLAQAVQSSDF